MNPEKERWVLLVVLSIIWGSSFILIKKSLEHFNPYEVGALRVLIAGILLLPMAILNIKKFPRKYLKWLILAAVTGNFIPMFLFPIAETKVSSSIAGIINSNRFIIDCHFMLRNFYDNGKIKIAYHSRKNFIRFCVFLRSDYSLDGCPCFCRIFQ